MVQLMFDLSGYLEVRKAAQRRVRRTQTHSISGPTWRTDAQGWENSVAVRCVAAGVKTCYNESSNIDGQSMKNTHKKTQKKIKLRLPSHNALHMGYVMFNT